MAKSKWVKIVRGVLAVLFVWVMAGSVFAGAEFTIPHGYLLFMVLGIGALYADKYQKYVLIPLAVLPLLAFTYPHYTEGFMVWPVINAFPLIAFAAYLAVGKFAK